MWWTLAERNTVIWLGLTALSVLAILMGLQMRQDQVLEAAVARRFPAWEHALDTSRRIDVNTATASELQRLPGIGPALAERIVADRIQHGPFREPQELERVPGIGPKTRQVLADYVTMP